MRARDVGPVWELQPHSQQEVLPRRYSFFRVHQLHQSLMCQLGKQSAADMVLACDLHHNPSQQRQRRDGS